MTLTPSQRFYQKNRERIIAESTARRKANRLHYNALAVRRRHEILNEAKEILGGKCDMCGATEKLEFDHINPQDRKNGKPVTNIMGRKELHQELEKCRLLCHSCHRKWSAAQQAAAWEMFINLPLKTQVQLSELHLGSQQ